MPGAYTALLLEALRLVRLYVGDPKISSRKACGVRSYSLLKGLRGRTRSVQASASQVAVLEGQANAVKAVSI